VIIISLRFSKPAKCVKNVSTDFCVTKYVIFVGLYKFVCNVVFIYSMEISSLLQRV
jgi:hypothetical protein